MNSNEEHTITFQTLNELVIGLIEEDKKNYNNIISSMKLPISDFENYCSWSKESYTRNCIIENEKFELILLCWEPEQRTAIHDHGGEECWVKIIEGEFKETIYKVDEDGEIKTLRSTIAKKNDFTYMVDFMGFHRLENLSNKRSMSLHLYAKPIRSCKLFDEHSRKLVNKDLVYNTVPELAGNSK